MGNRFKVGDHVGWNSEAGHSDRQNHQAPHSCLVVSVAPALDPVTAHVGVGLAMSRRATRREALRGIRFPDRFPRYAL